MITRVQMISPVFKQRYVNRDGSVVNVDKEAIRQAETQMEIRKSVENAIKQSDDKSVKYGDVYFTMFSDGSCKLSKDRVIPIYQGKAHSVNVNRNGWISSEINANNVSWNFKESSDEGGRVRANGNSYKFAVISPDGDIYIRPIAEELFPVK